MTGAVGVVGAYFWRRSGRPGRPVSTLKASPDFKDLLIFWFGPEIFRERRRLNEIDYLRGRSKMWYMSGTKHDEACKGFVPLLQMYDPSEFSTLQLDESTEQNLAKVVLFDQSLC